MNAATNFQGYDCWPLSLRAYVIYLCLPWFVIVTSAYNECEYGDDAGRVARTCREVAVKNQYCIHESALRWIDCGDGGEALEQVYCDMSHMGGGWQRLAKLNFTSSDPCPANSTWMPVSVDGLDYCSTVNGYTEARWILYPKCSFSEISGYVLADQRGRMEGFYVSPTQTRTLYEHYVDGVSITYGAGNSSSVRQHIFTYAVGRDELARVESCPCHGAPISNVPYFVQFDYHCDSAYAPYAATPLSSGHRTLWSGEGCGVGSVCCSSADTPWFYRVLHENIHNQPLEVRILSDAGTHTDEMILIREIALYVR